MFFERIFITSRSETWFFRALETKNRALGTVVITSKVLQVLLETPSWVLKESVRSVTFLRKK